MSNTCHYCGIQMAIPEQGQVTMHPKQYEKMAGNRFVKPEFHQKHNRYYFSFQSTNNLITLLEEWLKEDVHNEWMELLDNHNNQMPITVQHLYERATQPALTSIIYNGEFTSHIQPIIDLKTQGIFGYEALLRTTNSSTSPGDLFAFAQRAGLHSMLDQKAREEAVKSKAKHIPKGQKCFINFLPSTIYVPEYCLRHTFNIVKHYDVAPSDLVFEVVETEKITNMDHLKNIFETYQASGMNVALDDVGSGYSTIEVLNLLKPHIVKIDREYIRDCHLEKEKQDFLLRVINTAYELGVELLAEGIETIEEYNWLQNNGIQYGQGYYIGKPSPYPIHSFSHA
ncbi:EAL domain-containing protein [Pontibacillus yanchengensis]|uniref:EAL domain-containing protein n=1 Tax=Pontibacillus yanchengensis TaxID=462910 RepID=A0ACC7VEQ3_9BACI|nr:EAL domain-containing protein [Pontibacillus yanchengensis]MYL53150.1 EAL domain-containing protein [Pontibacillus yanchengensis]